MYHVSAQGVDECMVNVHYYYYYYYYYYLWQETEGVTPSISSCASSQTGPDSEASPSRGGLRASEWARQVKWETTPNKQKAPSPSNQGDSAKKKRKFAK